VKTKVDLEQKLRTNRLLMIGSRIREVQYSYTGSLLRTRRFQLGLPGGKSGSMPWVVNGSVLRWRKYFAGCGVGAYGEGAGPAESAAMVKGNCQ
jgi:hypothetical protein